MTAKQFVLERYPLAVHIKHPVRRGRAGKPQFKYCMYINLEDLIKENPFTASNTVCRVWEKAKSIIEEMEKEK